jgi:hypothetical protein
MPKRRKTAPARAAPIQLPLFAEAATLIRLRPERNEWRFYRLEVWPDPFGKPSFRANGAASAPQASANSIRIPIQAQPSMPSLGSPRPRAAGAAVSAGTPLSLVQK